MGIGVQGSKCQQSAQDWLLVFLPCCLVAILTKISHSACVKFSITT